MQEIFDLLYSKSQEGQKFYNLIDIMTSEENIRLAYRNIKRNTGSKTAGVDGLTIKDIQKLTDEEVVSRIQRMFNFYKPQKVRRVFIPKPNGKQRPLGIPCIWDRLFQQCILQVLEPICESKFYKHSYGFRPNRSTHHAIARMQFLINMNGLHHCVDIDIKGFFDNVNHGKLLKQLWTLGIREKKLLSIISTLLKAEIKGEGKQSKGTPQGGILSPLLSNVVLNELDWWVSNQWETFETEHNYSRVRTYKNGTTTIDNSHKYEALKRTKMKEIFLVRYADDFKILCRTRNQAKRVYQAVIDFLFSRLQLNVSDEKSKVINLKKSYSEFLGIKIKVKKKGKTKRGYATICHMTDKSKSNSTQKIKNAIKKVQENPRNETVHYFNSVVHGIQNYYKVASRITLDLSEIKFSCRKTLYNRLYKHWKKAEFMDMSKTQQKRYKGYNTKLYKIQNAVFSPIYAQKHKPAVNFSQVICNYTKEGREKIHKSLMCIDKATLRYVQSSYIPKQSIEYNDNRISKFIAQYGKCYITKQELGKYDWHCHHKIPRKFGGNDNYQNLVILQEDIHRLIHMTDETKIRDVLKLFQIKGKSLEKLNELRRLAHMPIIGL